MIDYVTTLFNKNNIDYADARIEKTHYFVIKIENDEFTILDNSYEGIGLRILNNGTWGFSSINSIDKKAIDNVYSKAYKLSKVKMQENYSMQQTTKIKSNDKQLKLDIDVPEWINKLQQLSNSMKNTKIKNRSIVIMSKLITKQFINSEGTMLEHNDISSYGGPSVVAKSNNVTQNWTERTAVLDYPDKINDLDIKCDITTNKVLELIQAKPCPKGKFDIVMDPHMVGVFVHEAMGHACEADAITEKASVLKDKLNTKIGSEQVTIIDKPDQGFGTIKYDDEGVIPTDALLVDKGTLKGFMQSRETANELKSKLTGNARATNYFNLPIVRMRNTLMMPGNYTKDEVLNLKDGIYVKGMKGGVVDPMNGQFMFAAKEGYVIKNGEKTQQLRDISLSSDILTTLHNINSVGKDIDIGGIGFCGKRGQSIRTGDGGPHVSINDMVIG